MRRLLTAATTAAVLVFPAGAEAAGGNACDTSARVTAGSAVALDVQTGHPTGEPVARLRRGPIHVYSVSASATLVFQGVRYQLGRGSRFVLGCFGETKGAEARFPRLALGVGRVTVRTAEGTPGAVSNAAAMASPQGRGAMTFTVRARSYWRLAATRRRSAPGRLAITPYAGPRKGTCRYVRSAAALDAKADTASYDGTRAR
jgi:hypothetical protein